MAIGLYIHIPFCLKKCRYCDFVSYPYRQSDAEPYVIALEKEMARYAAKLNADRRKVSTIYVGGGTPSCLPGEQLALIMDNCRRYFDVATDAEVTVECNPGTVDLAKFRLLRAAGINRISMGVQAFQQELLSQLGRIHNWQQVFEAVQSCRTAGFDNLSLDLIFGIPGQTMEDWRESLEQVTALSPQHLSAYNLKIEPDTPLYRDVTAGYLFPCDEDLELEMFWHTIDYLTGKGFGHYEISNFALPGREARHNLVYWRNEEYLGLGPAAHSMVNGHRFSNVESVELYISRMANDNAVIHRSSRLTDQEAMGETVFLGLRLIEGLDVSGFAARYGCDFFEVYGNQYKKLAGLGLLELVAGKVRLTDKGLPLANEVFVEFI